MRTSDEEDTLSPHRGILVGSGNSPPSTGGAPPAGPLPVPGDEDDPSSLRLGICSRDRKVFGPSMQEILRHLKQLLSNLEVVIFGDETILNGPPENWPVVDFVIAFHTHSLPIDTVRRYVELRRPQCFNNVFMQEDMLNRLCTYQTLQKHGIPCPDYVVVDHNL